MGDACSSSGATQGRMPSLFDLLGDQKRLVADATPSSAALAFALVSRECRDLMSMAPAALPGKPRFSRGFVPRTRLIKTTARTRSGRGKAQGECPGAAAAARRGGRAAGRAGLPARQF